MLPLLNGHSPSVEGGPTLADICLRVSCGVATGSDQVFVRRTASLPGDLASFAYPTIAGRQLVPGTENVSTSHSMLVPYDQDPRARLYGPSHLAVTAQRWWAGAFRRELDARR